MEEPRTRLFSNRNFSLLLSGQTISVLGDFFGLAALSIVTLELTGTGMGVAVNWILFFVPRSAMRFLGGPLVDRWDRRKIMMASESARGALFAALMLAAVTGGLSAILVYLVSALVGMLGALFQMANDALVPSIVEKHELVRANSYMGGSTQAATVAGWALAGFSIAAFGTGFALGLDSASFFVLVIALAFIRPPPPDPAGESRASFVEQLRQGLTFFRERRALLWLSLYFTCINFFLSPFWNVYLVVFSQSVLRTGAVGFGLINAVETAGLALGSLAVSRSGSVRRRAAYLSLSMLVTGIGVVAFGFSGTLPLALATVWIVGFSIPFANIVEIAIFQERVPNNLRGRVFGLKDFFSFVATPAGLFLGGVLTGVITLNAAILFSGLCIAATALLSLLVPSFRKFDEKEG